MVFFCKNEAFLMKMVTSMVIVVSSIFFYDVIYDGTEPFKSTFDNKDYRVRDTNKQLKANLLSIINLKFNIIIDTPLNTFLRILFD